jgi:hypothetical protein
VNHNDKFIEVGVVRMSDRKMVCAYKGKCAQDVYLPMIKDGWIKMLDHAAYMGKELKKCEFNLLMGSDGKYGGLEKYQQE